MTKETDIEKTKKQIMTVLKNGGGYMNNIVGVKLRMIAEQHGKETANQIVEDMGLEELIGIPKAT